MIKKNILFILIMLITVIFNSSEDTSLLTSNNQNLLGSTKIEDDILGTTSLINNELDSETLILVSDSNIPNILSATPLIKIYNGEIHLTSKLMSPHTFASLSSGEFNNAIIIGNTKDISKTIESNLKFILGSENVERISGNTIYETSALIAKKINSEVRTVPYTFIASGEDFIDVLSISSIAAMTGSPIILTNGATIPGIALDIIDKTSENVYKLGDENTIGNNFDNEIGDYIRLYGNDVFDSNLLILKEFEDHFNGDTIFLASSLDYENILVGSALAAKEYAPIIFANNFDEEISKIIISKLNKSNLISLSKSDSINISTFNELKEDIYFENTAPDLIVLNKNISVPIGTLVDPSDFKASAFDEEDGDISSKIKIEGMYNFNNTGIYPLTLSVSDILGSTSKIEVTLRITRK